MNEIQSLKDRQLTLDNLSLNPRLARRLSAAVACRYHALPVAEEDGHITVAMAEPENLLAREAVAAALGTSPCVVACDPIAIGALLTELWPEDCQRSLQLLVCAHASPTADEVLAFAHSLGGLLGAQVSFFSPLEGSDLDCAALARVVDEGHYDLVIWGEPDPPLGQRVLAGPAYRKAIKRIRCSLLVMRRPRWPLGRLLLVVGSEEIDDAAVDWIVRIARPSGAAVTVLSVVPPVPAMYSGCARMQQGLDALLARDSALGQQMRRVAQWLVDWEVEATLLLRQGIPDQEIRCEVFKGDYDLVAVAHKPDGRWRRWLARDWVASLLGWADRPVLIGKQTIA